MLVARKCQIDLDSNYSSYWYSGLSVLWRSCRPQLLKPVCCSPSGGYWTKRRISVEIYFDCLFFLLLFTCNGVLGWCNGDGDWLRIVLASRARFFASSGVLVGLDIHEVRVDSLHLCSFHGDQDDVFVEWAKMKKKTYPCYALNSFEKY